jgi:hypothetical protein
MRLNIQHGLPVYFRLGAHILARADSPALGSMMSLLLTRLSPELRANSVSCMVANRQFKISFGLGQFG